MLFAFQDVTNSARGPVGDFEGGRLSTDSGALPLRQADAPLDLTPRLAATTGARGGSSIRCGSWFRSGCSAFCRVGRTSTTGSGPTARWRWLSGDLTGEERGRDRGIPLAGHREPVRACPARSRRTGTRRSRPAMDGLKVDLSLDACPSPRDLSERRLHRRPGARQPEGASRLLLLLPSALQGRPWVRGCGLRTSTRRRARWRSWRGSAGRRPSFAATAGATERGAKTTESMTCCPATPA